MLLKRLVTESESGRRLSTFLRREMGLSNALLKRLKAQNALLVSGQPVHADYLLHPGDLVTVDLALTELPSALVPEAGPLDICFEDAYFLVVNKPSGLAVHPSRAKPSGTLANFAAGYLGGPVHLISRLDRDTSGLVLLAKSAYAKAAGIQAMQGAEKIYAALTFGRFDPPAGRIQLPIGRDKQPGSLRRVVDAAGQAASTLYWSLQHWGPGSLLHFRLETGRTHQIRVHCAYMGHPILGDRLYGTEESQTLSLALGISRQQLHARSLRFRHPFTGQQVSLCIPADFEKEVPPWAGT